MANWAIQFGLHKKADSGRPFLRLYLPWLDSVTFTFLLHTRKQHFFGLATFEKEQGPFFEALWKGENVLYGENEWVFAQFVMRIKRKSGLVSHGDIGVFLNGWTWTREKLSKYHHHTSMIATYEGNQVFFQRLSHETRKRKVKTKHVSMPVLYRTYALIKYKKRIIRLKKFSKNKGFLLDYLCKFMRKFELSVQRIYCSFNLTL